MNAAIKALERYPWLAPPPGFYPIDRNSSAAIQPNSTSVLEEIILSAGFEGWIVSAGLELSDFSNGFMTLLTNGSALRDYTKITVPLGAPDTPSTLYIPLEPSQILTLTATNSGTATIAARWRLSGWYYKK